MKVTTAIAQILKREGVEFLIGYPVNPIIEGAAEADIRTIMVRQERIGLHMCDAVGKLSSGEKIGVFVMQHGPGTENAFGGVAQSWGDSCPVVVLPAGYARNINQVRPNFNAALNYRNVTKWCEQVTVPSATEEALRRAFTQVKNGRPGPVLIEFPSDLLREEISGPLDYQKTPQLKSGPDPRSVSAIAAALVGAQRPVICAGQGVHYGKAWKQLQELAELLEAPVMTTLPGKSAFPEAHPLALGSGGIGISKQLHTFLQKSDLVFGIGCSFTRSSFATPMPKGKRIAPQIQRTRSEDLMASVFPQAAACFETIVGDIQIPDHPQHASQHDLAPPQDIFEHSDYTYAKGERPLADFGMHPSEPEPLGDIARTFRIEHASAKKAAFVFEKYVAKKY